MRPSLAPLIGLLLAAGCFADPPRAGSSGDDTSTSAGDTTSAPASTTADASTTSEDDSTTGGSTTGTLFETTGSTGSTSTGIEPGDTGDPTPMCPPDGTFVYLNFGGAMLVDGGGTDDAPNYRTSNPLLVGGYGPYTGSDRPMIVARVRNHFDPAGICVTETPPPSDHYDMIVVTSDPYDNGLDVVNLPNLDCENTEEDNLNVVFLSDAAGFDTARAAIAISRAAAELFGLERVNDPTEIMNDSLVETLQTASFTDVCHPLMGPPVCANDPICPIGLQNSLQRLSSL